jgi:hypothetical protein
MRTSDLLLGETHVRDQTGSTGCREVGLAVDTDVSVPFLQDRNIG